MHSRERKESQQSDCLGTFSPVIFKVKRVLTLVSSQSYCLGGQLVTLLSNVPDFPASVFVVAHPGPLSVDNFKKIRGPFALISSEGSFIFFPLSVDTWFLRAAKVDSFLTQSYTEDMYFDGIRVGAIAALGEHTFPTASYDHPGTTHGRFTHPLL